ncbi:hypothetical protein NMG60_11013543 [Bertholletia excelsa]
MDPYSLGNSTSNAPRKVRFAPKGPPRRDQKPIVPKIEKVETVDADDAQAQELLRRFNDASVKVKPKAEKKMAQAQVAFGYAGASASVRSFGIRKNGATTDRPEGPSSEGGDFSASRVREKEYREPWNYYSYYPVTLPLRRPYSGNPEILNDEEFGEASVSMDFDEDSIKPAVELGLMEENLEQKMFFLQLPPTLPMVKQSANIGDQGAAGDSKPPLDKALSKKPCGWDELPAGYMGKLLVYKNGDVKLKLGDTTYEVSAGSDCTFAEDVFAINTEEKTCCIVGELGKRAIITPDIDSVLGIASDQE